MPLLPISASDITRRNANRVLYANKVIQETALEYQLRNSVVWEGDPGKRAGSNKIYSDYVIGMLETTPAERDSYIATVAVPNTPTNIRVIVGNSKLIVFFDAPTNTTVNFYTVSTDSGLSTTGTSSPVILNGITNGTLYTISVTATNVAGTSLPTSLGPIDSSYTFTTTSFTSTGSVSWTAPAYVTTVEYLVVGGGGGGGGGYDTGGGGGGGGGMVLTGSLSVIPESMYAVTVGSGGAASTNNYPSTNETDGGDGQDSIFGSITSFGGQGGKRSRFQVGGSGAGGAAQNTNIISGRGGNGGGSNGGGGGGGGSSGAGTNKSGTTKGLGGNGTSSSISGSSVVYGKGGDGATGNSNNAGSSGTDNRGMGGNGGGFTSGGARNGGAGGSGIVVIKY